MHACYEDVLANEVSVNGSKRFCNSHTSLYIEDNLFRMASILGFKDRVHECVSGCVSMNLICSIIWCSTKS